MKSKVPSIEKAGKVKVKVKSTPAIHIHTPKQVVLKSSDKKSGKQK